jgi:rSAM/selenodomain-associated transferase 2
MNSNAASQITVGVVIPVINEAANLPTAVERAWAAGADRVLVADGGSSDGSWELLSKLNCDRVQTAPGRGIQLNHGARHLDSTVVLFLHADCWLEPGGIDQIRVAIDEGATDWGGFCQQIENSSWKYRWLEWGNRQRVWWQRLVYGDQGLWVRREWYDAVGGFPEIPLMEDFVLSQRLAKRGRPRLLAGPLMVNARRWEKRGVLRQTLLNWRISMMFRCGAKPEELVRLYRRHDG